MKRMSLELLLHDPLHPLGVRCFLVSFVSLIRIGFSFRFRSNGLDLFYQCNLFRQATLKGDVIALDLDDFCDNISSAFVSHFYFDSESVN